jgi:hypothetical protein
MQAMLRGGILESISLLFLDSLNTMDNDARVVKDQSLMTAASMCVLHERFSTGLRPHGMGEPYPDVCQDV